MDFSDFGSNVWGAQAASLQLSAACRQPSLHVNFLIASMQSGLSKLLRPAGWQPALPTKQEISGPSVTKVERETFQMQSSLWRGRRNQHSRRVRYPEGGWRTCACSKIRRSAFAKATARQPRKLSGLGLAGFEPATLRLSSACSNQLSYRPAGTE